MVKDLALSLLWPGFDTWSGHFCKCRTTTENTLNEKVNGWQRLEAVLHDAWGPAKGVLVLLKTCSVSQSAVHPL